MLTLDELSQNVAAYQQQRMSLEDFENWFEDNSSGAYEVPGLREACTAVDAALSEYYYDHIGEDALKAELANAVRPFAERPLSWEKHPLGVFVLKNIDASTAVVGTVGTVGEWDWSPELWPYAVAESQVGARERRKRDCLSLGRN